MAAVRSVLRTSLLRNSFLQASRFLGLRGLSTQVDDHVSGITDQQKQVSVKLLKSGQVADATFNLIFMLLTYDESFFLLIYHHLYISFVCVT